MIEFRSMQVEIEGIDKLMKDLSNVGPQWANAVDNAVKKAGMSIIGDAQKNLRTAGEGGRTINATGRLSQSGKVVEDGKGAYDIGFFNDGNGYAEFVEYGTKPHWPPVDFIRAWVKKKLRVALEEEDSVAYLISRKIAQKGTKPHPFFKPAVDKNSPKLTKEIETIVKQSKLDR